MLTKKIGVVIIEALHMLKEPAQFKDIVTTVAFLLKSTVEDVQRSVQESLEGGLRYGFLRKYRNRYAFKMSSTDYVESNRNIKRKQPQSKFNSNSKNANFEAKKKSNISQNTTVTIRTLFKAKKPMHTSGDLSLKISVPYLSSKRKKNSIDEPSIKSLPVMIKEPPLRTVRKLNQKKLINK